MTKNQQKNGISRRQELALLALLENPSVTSASKVSGISRSTIHKYLSDENFNAEYRKRRRELFGQTTAALTKVSSAAVVALYEIIADKSLPVTGRVSAARAILQYAESGLKSESTAFEMAEILAEIENDKRNEYR